ncbi:MAG TPA: hypothetical protein VG253_07460 [Streptosporangiaceae bacterium]|jgi:hypothetical protein|nr:hypothetical protein [Streptosporangiaceae bacterium]
MPHRGTGCTLGDIIAGFAVFGLGATVAGPALVAEYIGDSLAAVGLGIVFQVFAIARYAACRWTSGWPRREAPSRVAGAQRDRASLRRVAGHAVQPGGEPAAGRGHLGEGGRDRVDAAGSDGPAGPDGKQPTSGPHGEPLRHPARAGLHILVGLGACCGPCPAGRRGKSRPLDSLAHRHLHARGQAGEHGQHRRQFLARADEVVLDGVQGLSLLFADAHHRHLRAVRGGKFCRPASLLPMAAQ